MNTDEKTAPPAGGDSCFIDPDETVWLDLDGAPPQVNGTPHRIEVKCELGFAQEQALKASMYRALRGGGEGEGGGDAQVVVDVKRHAIDTLRTWIVDWTLTGKGGKRIEVSRGAIENLRGRFSDAITEALTAHIDRVESEKKAPSPTRS